MTAPTIFAAKNNREKLGVVERKPVATHVHRRFGFLKHLDLPPIPDSAFFDPLPKAELELWNGEGTESALDSFDVRRIR